MAWLRTDTYTLVVRALGRALIGITGCLLGIYALGYALLFSHPANAVMPALYFEAGVDAIGAVGCLIAFRKLAPEPKTATPTTPETQHVS
jgi:hypothetical protein